MNTLFKSTLVASMLAFSASSAFAGTTFLIVPNDDTRGASRVMHSSDGMKTMQDLKEGRATLSGKSMNSAKTGIDAREQHYLNIR